MKLLVISKDTEKTVTLDCKVLNKHTASRAVAAAKLTGYVTVLHEKTGQCFSMRSK